MKIVSELLTFYEEDIQRIFLVDSDFIPLGHILCTETWCIDLGRKDRAAQDEMEAYTMALEN